MQSTSRVLSPFVKANNVQQTNHSPKNTPKQDKSQRTQNGIMTSKKVAPIKNNGLTLINSDISHDNIINAHNSNDTRRITRSQHTKQRHSLELTLSDDHIHKLDKGETLGLELRKQPKLQHRILEQNNFPSKEIRLTKFEVWGAYYVLVATVCSLYFYTIYACLSCGKF